MKYGQIAGNKSINAAIYRCFQYIPEENARVFVRKFKQQAGDEQQVMHTFRELLLGGFLGSNGFKVQHDHVLSGKTPDWSIFDTASRLQAIVELVNFHTNKSTEKDIERGRDARGIWAGWMPSHDIRLYGRLEEKAIVYTRIAEQQDVPYVVALFSEFTADVDEAELQACLLGNGSGLFSKERALSGILFFEEQSGRYAFKYLANPHAARTYGLPSGLF